MRRAEETGGQLRALYPGCGGQKGGDGEQKGGADQQTTHQAEDSPAQAVGEAETDGVGSAAKEPAQKGSNKGDRRQDDHKGDKLREGRGGEQIAQMAGEIGIAPEGHGQTDEEAGEVESGTDEAVQDGAHDGVEEERREQPVKRIEAG